MIVGIQKSEYNKIQHTPCSNTNNEDIIEHINSINSTEFIDLLLNVIKNQKQRYQEAEVKAQKVTKCPIFEISFIRDTDFFQVHTQNLNIIGEHIHNFEEGSSLNQSLILPKASYDKTTQISQKENSNTGIVEIKESFTNQTKELKTNPKKNYPYDEVIENTITNSTDITKIIFPQKEQNNRFKQTNSEPNITNAYDEIRPPKPKDRYFLGFKKTQQIPSYSSKFLTSLVNNTINKEDLNTLSNKPNNSYNIKTLETNEMRGILTYEINNSNRDTNSKISQETYSSGTENHLILTNFRRETTLNNANQIPLKTHETNYIENVQKVGKQLIASNVQKFIPISEEETYTIPNSKAKSSINTITKNSEIRNLNLEILSKNNPITNEEIKNLNKQQAEFQTIIAEQAEQKSKSKKLNADLNKSSTPYNLVKASYSLDNFSIQKNLQSSSNLNLNSKIAELSNQCTKINLNEFIQNVIDERKNYNANAEKLLNNKKYNNTFNINTLKTTDELNISKLLGFLSSYTTNKELYLKDIKQIQFQSQETNYLENTQKVGKQLIASNVQKFTPISEEETYTIPNSKAKSSINTITKNSEIRNLNLEILSKNNPITNEEIKNLNKQQAEFQTIIAEQTEQKSKSKKLNADLNKSSTPYNLVKASYSLDNFSIQKNLQSSSNLNLNSKIAELSNQCTKINLNEFIQNVIDERKNYNANAEKLLNNKKYNNTFNINTLKTTDELNISKLLGFLSSYTTNKELYLKDIKQIQFQSQETNYLENTQKVGKQLIASNVQKFIPISEEETYT
ncbi:MAG: hypothetical protein N2517_03305, partial [Ignavibacteria bacterium]|nr:hypothetical protein [Ignavibacteria bacterium]